MVILLVIVRAVTIIIRLNKHLAGDTNMCNDITDNDKNNDDNDNTTCNDNGQRRPARLAGPKEIQ